MQKAIQRLEDLKAEILAKMEKESENASLHYMGSLRQQLQDADSHLKYLKGLQAEDASAKKAAGKKGSKEAVAEGSEQ